MTPRSRLTGAAAAAAAATAAANASAVKRFSAVVAGLDAHVHDASLAWKKAVWDSTLEGTRLEELIGARDALSGQLVAVTADCEAQRNALLARVWRALAAVWAAQIQRVGALERVIADGAAR